MAGQRGAWALCHLAHMRTALPRRGLGRHAAVNRSSPRRCARKPTPDDPWYWCRTTTSPWPTPHSRTLGPAPSSSPSGHSPGRTRSAWASALARGAARGFARQQHPGLPDPALLQQLLRLGRSLTPERRAVDRRAKHAGVSDGGPTASPLPRPAWPMEWREGAESRRPLSSPELGLARTRHPSRRYGVRQSLRRLHQRALPPDPARRSSSSDRPSRRSCCS